MLLLAFEYEHEYDSCFLWTNHMPQILETAKTAARRAADCIRQARGGKVERKASNDLVTEADLRGVVRAVRLRLSESQQNWLMIRDIDLVE